MNITQSGAEELTRFKTAVFEVLNSHSLLDHNLGLCYAHITKPNAPEAAYPELAGWSCATKVARLLDRVPAGECRESLRDWSDQAEHARAIRNAFAHGMWEYLPLRKERPVGIRVPPWMPVPAGLPTECSLDELEELAGDVSRCFNAFMSWRQRFRL